MERIRYNTCTSSERWSAVQEELPHCCGGGKPLALEGLSHRGGKPLSLAGLPRGGGGKPLSLAELLRGGGGKPLALAVLSHCCGGGKPLLVLANIGFIEGDMPDAAICVGTFCIVAAE